MCIWKNSTMQTNWRFAVPRRWRRLCWCVGFYSSVILGGFSVISALSLVLFNCQCIPSPSDSDLWWLEIETVIMWIHPIIYPYYRLSTVFEINPQNAFVRRIQLCFLINHRKILTRVTQKVICSALLLIKLIKVVSDRLFSIKIKKSINKVRRRGISHLVVRCHAYLQCSLSGILSVSV